MRCLVISVVLCISWSAQIHLRGSRKLDDSDGGFNEGAELHPDHFIEQERSLDELEKIESLIHSDKVAKLMKKAKTEVKDEGKQRRDREGAGSRFLGTTSSTTTRTRRLQLQLLQPQLQLKLQLQAQ